MTITSPTGNSRPLGLPVAQPQVLGKRNPVASGAGLIYYHSDFTGHLCTPEEVALVTI
jgi:hypothetical protein